jgi:hypothetical protein
VIRSSIASTPSVTTSSSASARAFSATIRAPIFDRSSCVRCSTSGGV